VKSLGPLWGIGNVDPEALVLRHSPDGIYPGRKPMVRDHLSCLVELFAASLAIALSLSPTAHADLPSWNGEYAITFIVGPKSGTSMATGDPEGQYTDT
jgi:hypothetical protein